MNINFKIIEHEESGRLELADENYINEPSKSLANGKQKSFVGSVNHNGKEYFYAECINERRTISFDDFKVTAIKKIKRKIIKDAFPDNDGLLEY